MQDIAPKVISDYPASWLSHYAENKYAYSDSTVELCKVATEPFTWEFTRELIPQNEIQRNYWNEANEFGLKDGISIA